MPKTFGVMGGASGTGKGLNGGAGPPAFAVGDPDDPGRGRGTAGDAVAFGARPKFRGALFSGPTKTKGGTATTARGDSVDAVSAADDSGGTTSTSATAAML